MEDIIIRSLDTALEERLRARAAQHGHSVEAEATQILQKTLEQPEHSASFNLYERIRARFEPLGGADDIEIAPRLSNLEVPEFD